MNKPSRSKDLNAMLLEFEELKARLEDAEDTIEAIRTGAIDALIVQGEHGEQVFTLKGADEPYRIFVEQMREGAITMDGAGTILYCNEAFAEMVDLPIERVMGSDFQDYFGQSPLDLEELASVGRREAVLVRERFSRPVICSSTTVTFEGPAKYAITITDLTEQKKHETALANATAELEGFCYSVSHDLRTPLRGMIGNSHILMSDYGSELPEQARERLERISFSASHLGRLIDDLLSYSRLFSPQLSKDEIDLSAIAQSVADNLSLRSEKEIHWEIQPGLRVNGDRRLLEMVIDNLLSNALKFSGKNEVIRISFAKNEDGAFFVADNGIGFDMQYEAKLFKPFERLHRPDEYAGTGIGLANVKRIISLHGGEVWAEGKLGEGATFYFTLP